MQRKNRRKGAKFCRGGRGFAGRILRGKCAWIFAEDSAQSENAAQAREKASWRRRKVQFRGGTGLPRAASAAPNPGMPYLRRMREAKWPDSEKLLGNFWPLSRNDFLKLRRQPGKKQVGAAGKFNSRVPQACLGAAAAAPNPGMQYLRRKRVQFQGATGLLHRRISGPKLAVYLLHADSA